MDPKHSAMVGSTVCFPVPHPAVGNNSNFTESTYCNKTTSTKLGKQTPSIAMNITKWSGHLFLLNAAIIPSTIPITTPIDIAWIPNLPDTGACLTIVSVTLRPGYFKDSPRFPRQRFFKNNTYCCGTLLSNPYLA